MEESTRGVSQRVTLEELAQEDRERQARDAFRSIRVNRRHGNKGSRQWGYMSSRRRRKNT